MKKLTAALIIVTTAYIGIVGYAVRPRPAAPSDWAVHKLTPREAELEARVERITEVMSSADQATYTLLEGERGIALDELKRLREVGYVPNWDK